MHAYNVVPHAQLSWFIAMLTMVYDTYIEPVHGVYKPTYL